MLDRPRAIATVLALGLAGCARSPAAGGAREPAARGQPEAAPVRPPVPAPSERDLRSLAGRLEEVSRCADTCCSGDLPRWLTSRDPSSIDDDRPFDEDLARALRRIATDTRDAAVRALAVRWLSAAGDVRDLGVAASCVEATDPVGSWPEEIVGQLVALCPSGAGTRSFPARNTLVWRPMRLGDACLEALSTIAGRRFESAAAWQSWTAAHPSPLDSYDYWAERFAKRSPPPGRLVDRLRTRSPEMLFRVLATRVAGSGESLGIDDAAFVVLARDTIGADRLVRLLARQERLPELEDAGRFAAFFANVLAHAGSLFGADQAPALRALWEKDRSRERLAVVVSRLQPADRDAILTATLAARAGGAYEGPLVLEEMARTNPGGHARILEDWFFGPALPAEPTLVVADAPIAILRGLRDARPSAAGVLRRLVTAHAPAADDPRFVAALVETVRAFGCNSPFPRLSQIEAPFAKGRRPTAAEKAFAASARAECVAAAVRCVNTP